MHIDPITSLKDLQDAARSCMVDRDAGEEDKKAQKDRFEELLGQVREAFPQSEEIPDTWVTLNDIPPEKRSQTFIGHHPQNPENKMVFISDDQPGGVVAIGDTHGDPDSIYAILKSIDFFAREPKPTLVFLGDYLGRGAASFEILSAALLLKRDFPDNVVLLQGNHEDKDELISDDKKMLRNQGYESDEEQKTILEQIASVLPLAAVYRNTLFVHSGLGRVPLVDGGVVEKLSDIILERYNVIWMDDQERKSDVPHFDSWEAFINSFDAAKVLGFHHFVRGHSHINWVDQKQTDYFVYTLISTGAGSEKALPAYKRFFPTILSITPSYEFAMRKQFLSDFHEKMERLMIICRDNGLELQSFPPPFIVNRLIELETEIERDEYITFVREAFSGRDIDVYRAIMEEKKEVSDPTTVFYDFKRREMSYLSLRGVSDKRTPLCHVNWNDGLLIRARFKRLNITHSFFRKADLTNATIEDSWWRFNDFKEANLAGITVSKSQLNDSKFDHADLRGARFIDTTLDRSTWIGVIIDDQTELDWNKYGREIVRQNIGHLVFTAQPMVDRSYVESLIKLVERKIGEEIPEVRMFREEKVLDFSNLDLSLLDLREANFAEALLIESNLKGANLSGVDLHTADTSQANWLCVIIDEHTQLSDEQWVALIEQNFDSKNNSTVRETLKVTYANLIPKSAFDQLPKRCKDLVMLLSEKEEFKTQGWKSLREADLSSSQFSGRLDKTILVGANLTHADFRGATFGKDIDWRGVIVKEAMIDDPDALAAILCQNIHYILSQHEFSLEQNCERILRYKGLIESTDLLEKVKSLLPLRYLNILSIIEENFSCPNQDFSNQDLSDFDLGGGVNFAGANFSGANLENSSLANANLRGANFTDTMLEGVDLRGADLRKARLDMGQSWVGVKLDRQTKLPGKRWYLKWLGDNLVQLRYDSGLEVAKDKEYYREKIMELFENAPVSSIRRILSVKKHPDIRKWVIEELGIELPPSRWQKTVGRIKGLRKRPFVPTSDKRVLSGLQEQLGTSVSSTESEAGLQAVGETQLEEQVPLAPQPKPSELPPQPQSLVPQPAQPPAPSVCVYPETYVSMKDIHDRASHFIEEDKKASNPYFDEKTYHQETHGFSVKTREEEQKTPTTVSYSDRTRKEGEYTIQLPWDIHQTEQMDKEQTKRVFAGFAALVSRVHPEGINIFDVPKDYKDILKTQLDQIGLHYIDERPVSSPSFRHR